MCPNVGHVRHIEHGQKTLKSRISVSNGYNSINIVTIGVDDGGGGGGGGIEDSNNIHGRHKHRKSCEAEFFRLDKIQDVDLLNQSGTSESSISGSKDEVIR